MSAAADVRGEVGQQVALIGWRFMPLRPQMMMGVADEERRLQRRFRRELQPRRVAYGHEGYALCVGSRCAGLDCC